MVCRCEEERLVLARAGIRVHLGGFVGDDESDNVELASSTKPMMLSMVKVTKKGVSRLTKTAKRGGDKKWKLDHLPPDLRNDFTNKLVPMAKCLAGTMLDPWSGLSADQVQDLVDEVFPDHEITVVPDDVWCGLISYRLSNWRNGFVNAAKDAIERLVTATLEENPEADIRELVAHYTTPRGDPPTTPYMWRKWTVNSNTLQIAKSGRLQNRLVIYTLAQAHFADYDEVPNPMELEKSELPCGALILAIQAVEHVFKWWQTGHFVEDKNTSGFFSADNYADSVKRVIGADGRAKNTLFLVAGRFKRAVESLDVETHWVPMFEDITTTLHHVIEKRRRKSRSQSVSSAASSDFIVESDMELLFESDGDED
ncbi:hypothetical protein CVT24_012431 [Panaeolus cyanescens]|uniref:DUF6532 domain-containing protein n=1 Tax=Panaeolus cyanescens TaxID=181874 RepID=A0A409WUD3_9AGAR|nr:hypothetical protein CVT24_012431 [Panaeolus cyanescens]